MLIIKHRTLSVSHTVTVGVEVEAFMVDIPLM